MNTLKLQEPYSDEVMNRDLIKENFLDLNIISSYKPSYESLIDKEKNNQVDILRAYSTEKHEKYIDNGFIVKPSWVIWILENKRFNNVNEYVTVLNKKDRHSIRKTIKVLNNNPNFKLVVEDVIKEENLKKFYDLYKSNIASMQNGVDLLKSDYKEFLLNKGRYKGIYFYLGDTLIGGVLCIKKNNMLRAIYLATLKDNINVNVSRYLYYTLIRVSIEDGYEFTSLGADPTLYGHMVSIGLFRIKRKMGFKPLPSKYMGEDSLDLYEKIVNIEKFNGLAMSLAYENNNLSSKKLDCYVFCSSRLTEKEKNKFRSSFFSNVFFKEDFYEEVIDSRLE
ncbi:peptidogalycan biosysnthesis protein [Evansella clarkii]|uniref:peptidogalycan biosysnthesis protein n=1 Tax=Evansella clarkii TaxID=79879 RepID=UPI000B436834|nr:peptidogalycan biosysnthesis protein [Evansella clarkii]